MIVSLRRRTTCPAIAASLAAASLAAASVAALVVLGGCAGRPAAEAPPVVAVRVMTPVAAVLPAWEPLPGGPGRAIQRVAGDKRNPGPFIERVRFPAGFSARAHTHTGDAHIFVLEGELHMGFGLVVDSAKAVRVGPGGYLHVPKGTPHYEWYTLTTIMQVEGAGPIATAMADTAAPRR